MVRKPNRLHRREPKMVGHEFAEQVIWVKKSGQQKEIQAIVDPDKITPVSDDTNYERGDEIHRTFNGKIEKYAVTNVRHMHDPLGNFPPVELEVRKTE